MNRICRYVFTLFIMIPLVNGCHYEESSSDLFKLLGTDHTGVHFENTITTSDSLDVHRDFFLYHGGGVAVGDINNDGLPDIFFAGNMVSNRLYLNKGDMQFEDISESSGVMTEKWATGVSMIDIDNDGFLDIYVSVSGPEWSSGEDRANQLFINNGDNTFTESASTYNIDDKSFTIHAVFFDYNRNGHLDMFLLNNSPEDFARGEPGRQSSGTDEEYSDSYDKLYRNNGDGTFTDLSEEAGILAEVGYGLGVVVADLNRDGWPDIYVSNDITPNDVLYINNKDGTFSDKAADWLKHTSFAGMGIDIADFTNNGWPDIVQTDMVPKELNERKRMSGDAIYSYYTMLRQKGFYHHYKQNTLQLNQGIADNGEVQFSEIARMSGVAYTNWSWSALFGDYNNDGYKDILITNGYPKAINDFDYMIEMHWARELYGQQRTEKEKKILEKLHSYKISNYIFRNNGSLVFTDKTEEWGMNHQGFSYGAAYADLNNNGRLDIVINNINAPAFIYENIAPEEEQTHYLQVILHGDPPNKRGIGSNLILTTGEKKQYIYHTPYRGYMSTMDDRVHFGLGEFSRVDSLEVIWPDGRYQVLTDLKPDQILRIYQENASIKKEPNHSTEEDKLFQLISNGKGLKFARYENKSPIDYNVQPLLPYMLSSQRSAIAVGDVTGNNLDDVYIGGDGGQEGRLFIQEEDGNFIESTQIQPWKADKDYEDWGAIFFDANGDGKLDLYVSSGGYHLSPVSNLLQDRLYINHGDGRFLKDNQALPQMFTSTASVTAGDFNGDGTMDLFVGGRLSPRNYPFPVRSYLLRNDGGRFTDITMDIVPEMVEPGGMITDAVWVDFNDDERMDLVTAGDWMPVQFYENDGKRLNDVTKSTGLPNIRGWWNSLEKGDFNNDGHMDFIAGNMGLNYSYSTSKDDKFGMYAKDLDGNGTTDIVFTQEIDGTEYPFFGFAKLGREFGLRIQNQIYESFSKKSIPEILSSKRLKDAIHYQVDTFASVYIQNNGDGSFTSNKLPDLAQISSINGIIADDIDGDGNLDLVVGGNLYQSEPNIPRADAGKGLWLRGEGTGNFIVVPPTESGFLAPLDVKDIVLINTSAGKALLVANNSDSLQVYTISNSVEKSIND